MELAFLSPSPMELMVIAVIALIVLGPSRLPDAARSVGKGMREMRDSFQGLTGDDEDDEPARRADLDDPDDFEDDPDLDGDTDGAPAASPGRS
jgi:sec-independent protein translocase protein TatA